MGTTARRRGMWARSSRRRDGLGVVLAAVAVTVSGCVSTSEEVAAVPVMSNAGDSPCQVAKHVEVAVQNATVRLADSIAQATGLSWKMDSPSRSVPPVHYSGRGGGFGFEQTAAFPYGSFGQLDPEALAAKASELARIMTESGMPATVSEVRDPMVPDGVYTVAVKGADDVVEATLILASTGYAVLYGTSVSDSRDWGPEAIPDTRYVVMRDRPECRVPEEPALPGVMGASLGAASPDAASTGAPTQGPASETSTP